MANNILELIGNTPIVELTKFDTGKCRLFMKLESFNPGGSIKDRIGLSMINEAEKQGKIKKGDTIIEATAGNTGIGLALVAIAKGYKLKLVIPDKMSKEKVSHLRAMGVEIIMTRSDVGKGDPEYYQDLALSIAKKTGAFYIDQFNNKANPFAHETTTGPEIWEQMNKDLDAVVLGIGSSGTITGLTSFFKKISANVDIILSDPKGSILAEYIEKGKIVSEAGSWLVEGIGEDFIPSICDFSLTKKAYSVSDEESFNTAKELLMKEGVFAGSSTGTLLCAALKYCREQKESKKVLTFACDTGDKYLSKMYNESWINETFLNNNKQEGFSTRAIHAGEKPDFREGATGDVVKPIHLATTFARKNVDLPTAGYEYTRSLNPTRKALEEKLASLEKAKYGLAFASGLAAETAIIHSFIKPGDHIIACDDLYGGTKRLFNSVFSDYKIKTDYVDATDLKNIENSISDDTKMIWLETPTNPLLKLCDIEQISKMAKKHNILTIVDNTFLTPFYQNPLQLGADVVIHSSTKYIGGHSDVLGGAVMTFDESLYQKLKFVQNSTGSVLSPFDSYLTMRGIKTLALRMEKHNRNAIKIADFLEMNGKVSKVFYPGLKTHPQNDLAKTMIKGFGGMISFVIKGDVNSAKTFLENLNYFALAESLGGVESLIEIPSLMTHASVAKKEREKAGISDTLIRMSVGIEDANDLINDLKQAFEKI